MKNTSSFISRLEKFLVLVVESVYLPSITLWCGHTFRLIPVYRVEDLVPQPFDVGLPVQVMR